MSASARGLPAHAHSFSVQQVVDAYAEALRGLSRDALIFEDLHQVIQVEVDLNADQTLSPYEAPRAWPALVRQAGGWPLAAQRERPRLRKGEHVRDALRVGGTLCVRSWLHGRPPRP